MVLILRRHTLDHAHDGTIDTRLAQMGRDTAGPLTWMDGWDAMAHSIGDFDAEVALSYLCRYQGRQLDAFDEGVIDCALTFYGYNA